MIKLCDDHIRQRLIQSTPDNLDFQGKSKKFRVIGSLKQITRSKGISKWMGEGMQLRYLHRQIFHFFASFLVVILLILSICHYIDSIPQFLRN